MAVPQGPQPVAHKQALAGFGLLLGFRGFCEGIKKISYHNRDL